MDYKNSGVDIEAGYKSVELMKKHVKETMRPEVLGGLGGFSGAFSLASIKDMEDPVLLSGTDGCGTKVKLAFIMDKHDTIGIDAVAMCVNDVACAGGEPLFFLDYIACGKNYPEKIATIVSGVAEGCKQSGCALVGGETAEHPGLMPEDEYDLAGFAVGVVDRKDIITGESLKDGDVLIGMASTGVHSNGFSLVRKIFKMDKETLNTYHEELGTTLGEALLAPTRIYVKALKAVKDAGVTVKACSHITGGGFYENIPRMLIDGKRPNIAGNVYTEKQEGINVHMYGAHIFHTNDKRVWNYITQFAEFNRFTNSPVANYKGELYSMPFNMYTFNKMWGVVTPEEAAAKIEEQKKEITGEPKNLEEQAISLVGRDIYEKLVKGYTEKQWGRDCKDLPAFIIKRLPVRLTFDNNYFNALYQGIPIGGYTKMVENLLDGIEVRLNTDYLEHKAELDALADKVVYTGPIDAYFGFKLGTLEYRSVRFENETLDIPNFQGNAAVNYTDRETPWTRIIEHKWFEFGKDEDGNDLPKTIISREYSSEWKAGDEPYYPVNDEKNGQLYAKYKELADNETGVIFGGRLGEYKYYDMDTTVASVLDMCEKELG